MKQKQKLKLTEKGWSEEEIIHAEESLDRAEKQDVHFSKIVFWSALIVTIFGNFIVSLILIPFLIVLNKWVLYSVVILLAGSIGFLYKLLITDIGHLEKKHHIAASIVIPLIAIANVVGMVLVSNRFISDLKVENVQHNPIIVAVVFAVVLILPYVLHKIFASFKNKEKVTHI
jgi:hypothetical protein